MLRGAANADVGLLVIEADRGFELGMCKGGVDDPQHPGELLPVGESREHALLCKTLGLKQLVVAVNKFEEGFEFSESRFREIEGKVRRMLISAGWQQDVVDHEIPIIPVCGMRNINIVAPEQQRQQQPAAEKPLKEQVALRMGWWKGVDVRIKGGGAGGGGKGKEEEEGASATGSTATAAAATEAQVHIHTLVDALEKLMVVPQRQTDKPFQMSVAHVYSVQGIGTVVAGRIDQGTLHVEENIRFITSRFQTTAQLKAQADRLDARQYCRIGYIEMHHRGAAVDRTTGTRAAYAGDWVGLRIEGLGCRYLPKAGDVMISVESDLYPDASLSNNNNNNRLILTHRVVSFTALVQVVGSQFEKKKQHLSVGYEALAFVRTASSPIKITAIEWKVGKESTGGQKMERPDFLTVGEMAQVVFEPRRQPFLVVDTFDSCEGLGRFAAFDHRVVVMVRVSNWGCVGVCVCLCVFM